MPTVSLGIVHPPDIKLTIVIPGGPDVRVNVWRTRAEFVSFVSDGEEYGLDDSDEAREMIDSIIKESLSMIPAEHLAPGAPRVDLTIEVKTPGGDE